MDYFLKKVKQTAFHEEMLKMGWHLTSWDEDTQIVDYTMYAFKYQFTRRYTYQLIEAILTPEDAVKSFSEQAIMQLMSWIFIENLSIKNQNGTQR